MRAFFSDRANLWMAGVFVIAAYLSLVNLGASPLWHDEATPAFMGENMWRNQTLSAWNGHSLYVGENGTAANSDLILASFPPWPTFPSALGIGLFGANEFGVRIFHTLLGLASLLLLWQLLCMDFPAQRLRVLAFTLFALSTQTILFMRLGRYVADSFFFTFLTFYAYRLYIARGGKVWHLALAAAATVLNFLNQFAIGVSFAVALGVWHIIYYGRSTTLRQWAEIGAAGAVAAALCFSYLVWAGILFSDDVLEFSEAEYVTPFVQRKVLLVYHNFRELVGFGHLPMWVALWFLWFAGRYTRRTYSDWKAHRPPRGGEEAQIMRWFVLLALFLLFSGLFSVRPPVEHRVADTRYIAPGLAITALLVAVFVEMAWRQQWAGKICAIPLVAVILCSNALALPYAYPHFFTFGKMKILLPNLLVEVHTSPYTNYLSEIRDYLDKHAEPGDTVFIEPWQDYTIMQFYLGDKLVFCCVLNDDSPLPKEKVQALGIPMYQRDSRPTWLVSPRDVQPSPRYEVRLTTDTVPYPTNRPELEFHTFQPLADSPGAPHRSRIYRNVE